MDNAFFRVSILVFRSSEDDQYRVPLIEISLSESKTGGKRSVKIGIIGNDGSDLAVLKSMILYICNTVIRFSSFPRIPEGCPIPVLIRDRSF